MQNGTNDLQEIRDLKDSKDELIEKAGDRLSSFLIKMNSNGVSNAHSIQNDINKALIGWTDDEKLIIMARALAKLVVNL
jgi:hypothetical protein